MTEPNNIKAGKKYRTRTGKVVTAVVDGVDKLGLAVVNADGEWCVYYPHELTEVVEIPERWVNVHDDGKFVAWITPEGSDANAGPDRIGVWHLKADGTSEFIPTP